MNSKPKKVLVIGSGPIVIGQAAEFDYAGTQACKSLKEEGVTTVLVNSNPATIMTDEGIADVVYIEPLTVPVLSRIIESERPDGILPTLGGQTGLNLAVDLADAGVLDKFNVRMLGTPLETIKTAEDRELFKRLLEKIGEPLPPSETVHSIEEARASSKTLGLPLVVRPAFTLGGTGGGIAKTEAELESIVEAGLAASPISQVLLEKSLIGWKELEYEVMRDANDNCITICNMENLDPMGVHTGDSIVTAPSQTLSDREYQTLRSASIKIIRALGIEGGCNVQFALAPGDIVHNSLLEKGLLAEQDCNRSSDDIPYYVIEVNPRVSRSSALASKATGYPIARVAAKIAIGKTLDQVANAVTEKTVAAFEPALDYCVVKIPRWPFDKFPTGDRILGTQMKATGEVMAVDRSFEAAFQKAVRSLEISNRSILWEDPSWKENKDHILENLPLEPSDQRLWVLMAALREDLEPNLLAEITGIDPWFIRGLKNITTMETKLLSGTLDQEILRDAKRLGFSDAKVAVLTDRSAESVRKSRIEWGIRPVYKMVDTCAAEFEAQTPYFYSTYEEENEASPTKKQSALVIGSGPIRIGQGIEFDYCSVHAAWALQDEGIRSVLVNSNPETVSTDFDTSDRLYFEPLDEESIRDILDNETCEHDSGNLVVPPSVVQFGGQTAINLSQTLSHAKLPILGSTAESIDTASDRHLFEDFLSRIGIPNPPGAAVANLQQALKVAEEVGYPVLVRPSYVLGGRAMEIVQNDSELKHYMAIALEAGSGRKVLIDKYFQGREVEIDAVCDGKDVLIPGIMEHIERAGVHSGDSMAVYPGLNLSKREVETIVDYTTRIGQSLEIKGLMNIQYVVVGGTNYRSPSSRDNVNLSEETSVFVIEVNPRSSRTIPFISKITGVPMVQLAVKTMLGRSLRDLGYHSGLYTKQKLVGIKAPVFSMSKLPNVDSYLGPEMKSTGEVMGIDKTFNGALAKALIASGLALPPNGSILLSLANRDKPDAKNLVTDLSKSGYELYATDGTAKMVSSLGVPVKAIPKKLNEGHPNVVDIIVDGTVDAVVNTVTGDRSVLQDGFKIRRAAVDKRIPCFTSLDTARAAAESLASGEEDYSVRPLNHYRV